MSHFIVSTEALLVLTFEGFFFPLLLKKIAPNRAPIKTVINMNSVMRFDISLSLKYKSDAGITICFFVTNLLILRHACKACVYYRDWMNYKFTLPITRYLEAPSTF